MRYWNNKITQLIKTSHWGGTLASYFIIYCSKLGFQNIIFFSSHRRRTRCLGHWHELPRITDMDFPVDSGLCPRNLLLHPAHLDRHSKSDRKFRANQHVRHGSRRRQSRLWKATLWVLWGIFQPGQSPVRGVAGVVHSFWWRMYIAVLRCVPCGVYVMHS